MFNRYIAINIFALLVGLFFINQITWALSSDNENTSQQLSTLKKAITLKKSGNINQAIKVLHQYLQDNPHDVHGKVELAANYFLAKDFSKGAKLFKKILKDTHTPSKIKKNISHFINQHKADIESYASLNKKLATIKRSSEITALKIKHTEVLLSKEPKFKKAQLYLVSLYLKQHRDSEAKRVLKGILHSQLTPEEESAFSKLNHYYHKYYHPNSTITITGSFILGHDSDIAAGGDSDLPGELDTQDSDTESEEDFNETFDEEFEEAFEEEFNEAFDEQYDEEYDGAYEEAYEAAYEEAYEEAYEDAFPDDCEDDCEEENKFKDKSGLFSRLNARIQMIHNTPIINDGQLTHSIESAVFANVTEREYQDSEAQHRNYRVLELGASIARRSTHNSRLALPISIKSIQLNGENYARFYEASMSYGFNINKSRISISEKFSYRDYQHFNEERENALLVKTSVAINRSLSRSLSMSANVAFTRLETNNTPYTSYDRFKASLGITYQVSKQLSFGIGNEYQVTNYNDYFKPEALEDCLEVELCYEENREDKFSNYYLDSQFKLNKNWSVKGRFSKSKRKTNHDKHEYNRTTFSAGIYMKF